MIKFEEMTDEELNIHYIAYDHAIVAKCEHMLFVRNSTFLSEEDKARSIMVHHAHIEELKELLHKVKFERGRRRAEK